VVIELLDDSGRGSVMSLAGVPVDHGLVLVAVTVASFVALALSLGRQPHRWIVFTAGLALSLAALYLAGLVVGIDTRVGSSFPKSF
jgi:hypothetical protein